MSAGGERAEALRQAYAHCGVVARDSERDRWLSALFAPEAARPHLHAIAAFDHEIGRIRIVTREPLAGEMRLTWWREALAGDRANEARGHPIAGALLDTIETFRLPRTLFENAISARQFDLYDDALPTLHDLEGYCGETCSSLFQLGALILAGGRDVGAADASGHAGVAFAVTRFLLALPAARATFLPRDMLARHDVSLADVAARRAGPGLAAALRELIAAARVHLAKAETHLERLPADVAPAYAPLAMIPLYLARLERTADAPFSASIEVAQWRRQWALWRWARRRKNPSPVVAGEGKLS